MSYWKSLLYNNTFLNPLVSSTKSNPTEYLEKMSNFRQYYEQKNKDKILQQIKESNTSEPVGYHKKDLIHTNNVSGIDTSGQEMLEGSSAQNSEDRFFKIQKTLVNIDSRDRDLLIYPLPNNYSLHLNRTFNNIKEVTLRSTEFPNSEQLIRDAPLSKANNKIYWQDEGFSDIFVANIPPGNYVPSTLQNAIQTAMNAITRPGSSNYHEFTVTIDTVSSICTFSSLITRQLDNPFSTTAGTSLVTITEHNHGFITGTFITISGAAAFAGINVSLLNANHVITVIDADTYVVDIVDIIVQSTDIVGGSSVRIGVGQPFKLLFSQPHTPANILGFIEEDTNFSPVLQNTAVANSFNIDRVVAIDTIYTAIVMTEPPIVALNTGDHVYISNVVGTSADELINDPGGYHISVLNFIDQAEGGLSDDEMTRVIKIPAFIQRSHQGTGGVVETRILNRPVKLAGENYILMLAPQISTMVNTGHVNNIFAKIDLSAPPGTILFNTFISGSKKYSSPLQSLDSLSFQFVDQNGDLFDFLDLDHSFTLEIKEEIHEMSSGVGIASHLGTRDVT